MWSSNAHFEGGHKSRITDVLMEQIDGLRSKRSVTLKLASFPSQASIPQIIEVLEEILRESSTHIERLLIADNKLTQIPDCLFNVCDDRLRVLDLHGNEFRSIPEVVYSSFPKLESLDLSSNKVWTLSSSIALLEDLRVLNLSNNEFSYIPPVLGELISLEKLFISGNPLIIPSSQSMKALEKDTNRLKAYLLSNSVILELSISQQIHNEEMLATRVKSGSESKIKASKASRRMGLIINKNKKTEPRSVKQLDNSSEFSIDETENPTSTLTSSGSPPMTFKARSRQNTMTEINDMLQQPELHDSEFRSGAYFRRLSTLQELPLNEGIHFKNRMDRLDECTKANDNNHGKSSLGTCNVRTHDVPLSSAADVEDTSVDLSNMLKVARKVLFSYSEFHSSIKRLTGFCTDRKVAARSITKLHDSKSEIDQLVGTMELVEEFKGNSEELVSRVTSCVESFRQTLHFLLDNFAFFVSRIDVCFIRMVYLTIFGAFNELMNAHKILNPTMKRSTTRGITADIRAKLQATQLSDVQLDLLKESLGSLQHYYLDNIASVDEVDDKLYGAIDIAVVNAQVVFNDLTKTINKSAVASTNDVSQVMSSNVASKFKDLTNTCISLMEITKRISSKLPAIRTTTSHHSKKIFWDDINTFLKAIIQTFSSVKLIMKDVPILYEMRQSMANLTKATKDLTILLEASSYSAFSESTNTGGLSWSSSQTNLIAAPPVRTPLVATVGAAAAQTIMPNNENSSLTVFGIDHSGAGNGNTNDQANYFAISE